HSVSGTTSQGGERRVKARTEYPASTRARAKRPPMKPVAPVTAIKGRFMRALCAEPRDRAGLEHGLGAPARQLACRGVGQAARRDQGNVAQKSGGPLQARAGLGGKACALG